MEVKKNLVDFLKTKGILDLYNVCPDSDLLKHEFHQNRGISFNHKYKIKESYVGFEGVIRVNIQRDDGIILRGYRAEWFCPCDEIIYGQFLKYLSKN
jgi:hypothetical protein